MNHRFQRYIDHTEILKPIYTPVEYIYFCAKNMPLKPMRQKSPKTAPSP